MLIMIFLARPACPRKISREGKGQPVWPAKSQGICITSAGLKRIMWPQYSSGGYILVGWSFGVGSSHWELFRVTQLDKHADAADTSALFFLFCYANFWSADVFVRPQQTLLLITLGLFSKLVFWFLDFCSSGKALDSSHHNSTINFAYLALFKPIVDSFFRPKFGHLWMETNTYL